MNSFDNPPNTPYKYYGKDHIDRQRKLAIEDYLIEYNNRAKRLIEKLEKKQLKKEN